MRRFEEVLGKFEMMIFWVASWYLQTNLKPKLQRDIYNKSNDQYAYPWMYGGGLLTGGLAGMPYGKML